LLGYIESTVQEEVVSGLRVSPACIDVAVYTLHSQWSRPAKPHFVTISLPPLGGMFSNKKKTSISRVSLPDNHRSHLIIKN